MAFLRPRHKSLTQYGPNKIEEKKTNEFLKFLSYFWRPIRRPQTGPLVSALCCAGGSPAELRTPTTR